MSKARTNERGERISVWERTQWNQPQRLPPELRQIRDYLLSLSRCKPADKR